GGLDLPEPIAEFCADDLLVEADKSFEPAVFCDLLDVGPDLLGRGVFARPAVIGLEWKFVLARQDVDKQAGEPVVAPRAADLARLFVDGEIDAGALQRVGHVESGDAGAGDHHPDVALSHVPQPVSLLSLLSAGKIQRAP